MYTVIDASHNRMSRCVKPSASRDSRRLAALGVFPAAQTSGNPIAWTFGPVYFFGATPVTTFDTVISMRGDSTILVALLFTPTSPFS